MDETVPQPTPVRAPENAPGPPPERSRPPRSARRPYLSLIVSLVTTVAALVTLHTVSQSVLGIRLGERTYLHARCSLGDVVIALNTRKAMPWLLLLLFLPPLALGGVSVVYFADALVTLFKKLPPEDTPKQEP